MRPKYLVTILVLLALSVPASPAHAGGIVSVCDEAHLLAALAGGGTVTFTCSGTITLTAIIIIASNTTIDGGGQTVTISGDHAVEVFNVYSGVILNLNRLTVANGNIGYYGGGIANGGTLNVSNSTFSGNSVSGNGGNGGGIYNGGTLNVSNSTFSGNSADYGGGIYNYGGTVTVSNSTFSGNSAFVYGGAISNQASGRLAVINSTFSGNSAGQAGGGISSNFGTEVTLRNTIVANSPAGGNCYSAGPAPITDGGGNLSFPDTTCPGINTDPMLGPLQNNLGPTETMALGTGSAALDAGDDAVCAADPVNNLDQRGVTRPQGPHCDMGAVEQLSSRMWLPLVRSR